MRGHLAAQIDPLGLNNMDREKAKKMIIRSVTVDQKVLFLSLRDATNVTIGPLPLVLVSGVLVRCLEGPYSSQLISKASLSNHVGSKRFRTSSPSLESHS